MTLHKLELDFFRNYVHLEAEFAPGVNVILGENAQGKTNLLEAAAYLSSARSPPGGGILPRRHGFTGASGVSCFPTG